MTVIKFPSKKKNLEDSLKSTIHEMTVKFDALNKLYNILDEYEDNLEEIQEDYNTTLEEYIRFVGADNVPVQYLEYSNKVRVGINEDGGFTLTFEDYGDEED